MLAGTGLTMRHYVTKSIIEGGGDRATATTYVLGFTGKIGNLMSTTGRHEDELRKVGGRWLLHVRHGIVEMPERLDRLSPATCSPRPRSSASTATCASRRTSRRTRPTLAG